MFPSNPPQDVLAPPQDESFVDEMSGAIELVFSSHGSGISEDYLIDFSGRAEQGRLQLKACQGYVHGVTR